ncbi:MAG: phospholipase [Bacteroidales bacterium]|nr:phospholipase [Bacteroidales bacterium]
MEPFIILTLSLLILGIVCFLADKWLRKTGRLTDKPQRANVQSPEKEEDDQEGCCGQHEICEKDSLLLMKDKIEYYDDEELDAYIGVSSEAYSEKAVSEFAEVFYTLKEEEVAGWTRSLQLRGIEIPETLKEEILMVVRERRFRKSKQ